METSPANEVFLILVGCLTQSSRLAISAQNPSGSFTERSYMARYLALSQWLCFAHCGFTRNRSDIAPSLRCPDAKAPVDPRPSRGLFSRCVACRQRRADLLPQRSRSRQAVRPTLFLPAVHRLAHMLAVFPLFSTY